VQRDFPQQGFVDHVVTPTVGTAWMVAEDALDQYLVKPIEARTRNRYVRIFARTVLNPARTFANVLDSKVPWYRNSRAGVLEYTPEAVRATSVAAPERGGLRETASLEFSATAGARRVGGVECVGGGAEGAWRVAPDWQMVGAVNGCKMTGLSENVSGDALLFQAGPRWTPSPDGKWSPFAHVLVGGIKVTEETMDNDEKRRVLEANRDLDPMLDYTLHGRYTRHAESSALALTAGMGVDYKLSPALAIRVANLEYLRSGARLVSGNGFQMTTGMVLRWGTW